MRNSIRLLISFVAVTLASCGSPNRTPSFSGGTVQHVVLMWMKNPDDANARRQIINATNSFREIPGILAINYGRPIARTRPVVDSSFHIGIVIVFKDHQAASAYETNPIHMKAVKDVLQPLVGKLQVYDILAQ